VQDLAVPFLPAVFGADRVPAGVLSTVHPNNYEVSA
jgi:hypothetical protein